MREPALVLLAGAMLAVGLTYPLAFHFDHMGRVNNGDGQWSMWVVAWVARALTSDPLSLFDANIFYPHRLTLAFSEGNFGAGVLGAPVWAATENPYATHNFVVLLAFALSFTGTYFLVRYLTGHRLAAVAAGVTFAFCPYIFSRTAHIQLLLTAGMPFSLLAFHRLVDRLTVGRAVTLGLTLFAQAISCAYYGIFSALMVAVAVPTVATTRRLWRSKTYWTAIGLAALVAIGLTFPFLLPYVQLQQETGFARTLDEARMYSATWKAWGASAAWAHRWWMPSLGEFNKILFPGILVTVLGTAGLARALTMRRSGRGGTAQPWAPREVAILYLLVAVLAFWASFGPDALLYRLFYETIPVFSFLRAPARMGVMVALALSVLMAYAIAWVTVSVRRPLVAGGVIALLAVADVTTAPLNQYREAEPVDRAYKVLASLPRGPVAEFPYWYSRREFWRHARYMMNSTFHWQPLINGYSDYIPREFRQSVRQLSSFPTADSFYVLRLLNARYVVFNLDLYEGESRDLLMQRLRRFSQHLRPIVVDGKVWLYEITSFPSETPAAATGN